jgi:putative membrane protein
MLVWASISFGRIKKLQHGTKSAYLFVLALPLMLLFLPHSAITATTSTQNYVGGSTNSTNSISSGYVSSQNSNKLSGLDTVNKRITVENEDFGKWINQIYMEPDAYYGYTLQMTGFVYKDTQYMAQDEFVTARLMMNCCSADLAPSGLYCKYDKASSLKKESWVTIEGTLFKGQYEYAGQIYDDPQLQITKVTKTNEVKGYVYPY